MIRIVVPKRVPTVNNLYYHQGNMKIIKKEARELREYIINLVLDQHGKDMDELEGKKLRVCVEIHENWFTKKGEVKKLDVVNREKFLTDSIFKGTKIDDKFIFEYRIKKVQSDKEQAVIQITEIEDEKNK